MAFSLGASLPPWAIALATGVITVVMVGYAWHAVPRASRWQGGAGAAIVAGAGANLVDRIPDGSVTDYLHTGWWPTFNLADVYIVLGVSVLALTLLRDHPTPTDRNRPQDTP